MSIPAEHRCPTVLVCDPRCRLRHVIIIVHALNELGANPRVIIGQGSGVDATITSNKLVFGIFAALTGFERKLISQHIKVSRAAQACVA